MIVLQYTPARRDCVRFSPDGRLLAAAAFDEFGAGIDVWDVAAGRLDHTVPLPGHTTYGLAFARGGEFLLATTAPAGTTVVRPRAGRGPGAI